VPLPYAQVAEGIVWSPDEAAVHAGTDGVITTIVAEPNAWVEPGQSLIRMEDPLLDMEVKVLEAQVRELRMRYEARDFVDPLEAKIIRERLQHTQADLDLELKHQEDLLIRSRSAGEFVVPMPTDLPGRYLRKGEILGYVHSPGSAVIKVIVPEDDADTVRRRLRDIEVRYVNDIRRIYPASLSREVPTLSTNLPSNALATSGGGSALLDPADPEGMTALDSYLQLELRSSEMPVEIAPLGTRVYVRFDLGFEPIGFRIYRSVRQVFLRRFSV